MEWILILVMHYGPDNAALDHINFKSKEDYYRVLERSKSISGQIDGLCTQVIKNKGQ